LTIDGFTFDADGDGADVIQATADTDGLTIKNSKFTGDTGGSEAHISADTASELTVVNNEFEVDSPGNVQAVDVDDTGSGGALNFTGNNVTGYTSGVAAVDLTDANDFTTNDLVVENNRFDDNDINTEDGGDVDTDALFEDNTFDTYVTVEDDGSIQNTIYGTDFDAALNNGINGQTTDVIVGPGEYDRDDGYTSP
jgi:hypothetical protein